MKDHEFFKEIQTIIGGLKAEEFPQTCGYLASIFDTEENLLKEPYEIANSLLLCDCPKPLPSIVRDLVIKMFRIEIDNGNAEAMNDLGAQYYAGSRGFEQDFSKAVFYYDLAAKHGSRQAQENLGYCYYYGRNMPVDYEKAFQYFALGAFDGHLISLYKIADMYANGYYVEKNEAEAFRIYQHCMATMTDEAAKVVAGPVYLRLGKCFLNGTGTEPDAEAALICYQKAEVFLYDMVKDGDAMYKKSLQAAIDGQAKARKKLAEELPADEWIYD